LTAGYTGNMKCAVFAAPSGTTLGAVLATATAIANPIAGNNAFTFPTPASLAKGGQFVVGFDSDTTSGTWTTGSTTGYTSATAYASFPAGGATLTTAQALPVYAVTCTPTDNNSLVNEAQQDGAVTYVYDSNVGDADLYGIAALSGTPAAVVAVTTRAFVQKSDAGTRSGAVQLKSGATTVQSPSAALSTSWGWLYRTDLADPATGAAWTVTAVNNAQVGPVVTV
jgi:hypothetical protein